MRAALDPNGAYAYWAGRFGLIPLLAYAIIRPAGLALDLTHVPQCAIKPGGVTSHKIRTLPAITWKSSLYENPTQAPFDRNENDE